MRRVSAIALLCLLLLTVAPPAQAVEVFGRVINFDGEAQADVEVSFRPVASDGSEPAKPQIAWSDGDGWFEFEDLDTGDYTATLTLAGFPPETLKVTVGAGAEEAEGEKKTGVLVPETLEVSW